MVIGVISDTHGLLRDEAVEALRGVDRILHAGDVGGADILARLEEVAPLVAIRGNTDHGALGEGLSDTEMVDLGGSEGPFAYIVHDIEDLDIDPEAAGVSVVVYGHSHRPAIEHRGGVLFFNPGAAGHRRFSLPITVGRLTLRDDGIEAEIIDLEAGGPL